MYISKFKPDAQIFSFEPIPETYSFLNSNIEINNLKNINSYNFGFSDVEGTFDFHFDATNSVNASLANLTDSKCTSKVTCNVKRLDEFIKNMNIKVNFIKCDVEGAELLVFKGGTDLIKKDYPIIFTEMLRKWTKKFNYHPNDIIKFFSNLGYKCYTADNNHLFPIDNVDENTKETNYFFLHNEKHANQIRLFSKK